MISPTADFHSKLSKGSEAETKRRWMFQIFSYGTTKKGSQFHRQVNTPLRFCAEVKIILTRLGLALKHWSLWWLVRKISRSHPE